jgi:NAD(P)-dependent dehydrogenase (short-subunit alcohol dehydrogenase family)
MKEHAQQLPYPAKQADMKLQPQSSLAAYRAAGKLEGKVALITGADSGIGRAVAVAFAKEGADVAILFNENQEDAAETKRLVELENRKCQVLQLDVRDREQAFQAVRLVRQELGDLNILVNNAAFQASQEKFEDITEAQIRRTFDTNILGYMWMAQAAIPHLKSGDCIINTGSVVGLVGIPILIDYACTKAGIHALTKSLALYLGEKNIRVNAVIPGPVWTPNIVGTMPMDE